MNLKDYPLDEQSCNLTILSCKYREIIIGCYGWMDGWMDGRMDGWIDGWMDG